MLISYLLSIPLEKRVFFTKKEEAEQKLLRLDED
jgi:hypothetical protein